MEAAILEGTRIIEAANPRIRFVYRGRTARVPQTLDGFNDFAFGSTALVQHDRRDGRGLRQDAALDAGFCRRSQRDERNRRRNRPPSGPFRLRPVAVAYWRAFKAATTTTPAA